MRIGCGSQCQVGKGKNGASLCTMSCIEVIFCDNKACFTISFAHFQQFYTGLFCKEIFFEKFLWSHVLI